MAVICKVLERSNGIYGHLVVEAVELEGAANFAGRPGGTRLLYVNELTIVAMIG